MNDDKTQKTALALSRVVIAISILLAGFVACIPASLSTERTGPVRIERPGLPNFYQVSPGLYRGGQPEATGVVELKKLGIRTVVNLRSSDDDTALFKESGIALVHIPMNAFWPREGKFSQFLKIASDPTAAPVFVHCQHGSDRTGTAVALYRIFVQKWTRKDAIREMMEGPFGFHFIHGHLKYFVRRFVYR